MFRLTAILLALSLLTTSVAAQKWIGFGGVSCGSWSEKRRTEPEVSAAYTVWVLGFVSGANVDQTILLGHPDFLKNTDKDGIVTWMNNYCASHPLDTVMTATLKLMAALRDKAVNGRPQSK